MHATLYVSFDTTQLEHTARAVIAASIGCKDVVAFEQSEVLLIEPVKKIITQQQIQALVQKLSLATQSGQERWVVLPQADRLGREAANSLLKLLEEPPARTHFILMAGTAAQVLPTIRSRTAVVAIGQGATSGDVVSPELHQDAQNFIASKTVGAAFALTTRYHERKELPELLQAVQGELHHQKNHALLTWLTDFGAYQAGTPNLRLLVEALGLQIILLRGETT